MASHFRHQIDSSRVSTNAQFQLMFQYPGTAGDSKSTAAHFSRACSIEVPEASVYARAYERWKKHVAAIESAGKAHSRDLKLADRALIGMSDASLWATNICLRSPYGVPYVPGSACKGLAVHFARQLGLSDQERNGLFESTNSAMKVDFQDAWWVPDSAPSFTGTPRKSDIRKATQPLVREQITPHHKAFLDKKGETPATPYDSPTPIPQLATHGSFLFSVFGPKLWAEYALNILQVALETEGIGARTPEYGRVEIREGNNHG